jgi:hypothetical protein
MQNENRGSLKKRKAQAHTELEGGHLPLALVNDIIMMARPKYAYLPEFQSMLRLLHATQKMQLPERYPVHPVLRQAIFWRDFTRSFGHPINCPPPDIDTDEADY